MRKLRSLVLYFAAAIGILSGTGCETVPKKYSMTDRGSLFVNEKEQSKLGAKAWEDLKRENRRARNRAYSRALNRVSTNLTAKYRNKQHIKWEFLVFESSTPNAFCLPGGKIAICSALFKHIRNDAELALVVGHEMAHALCRHASEQQEQKVLLDVLGTALELTMDDTRIHKGYSAVSHLGMTLPYSRDQEFEADYLGLKIATEAGYSPKVAIKFLEQLGKLPKSKLEFEFFSTHPLASNRKKKLEARLYEFQHIYDNLPKYSKTSLNKNSYLFNKYVPGNKRSRNIYYNSSNKSQRIREALEAIDKKFKKKK